MLANIPRPIGLSRPEISGICGLTLLARPARKGNLAPVHGGFAMSAPPNVLLAMDSARPQNNLVQVLETAGFTVQLTGFDSPLPSPPSRVVVVDCPIASTSNAASFVRRWREHRGDAESPVIWLAGTPDDRMAGWQAGADAVLASPLAFGELASQLERLT